ncbi:MAG: hypothetical protein KC680_04635 [Candidatus Peregrinibacteria bacterium]|nr:hypothetical protein [Candidatus Peregrinibacteria bacterium]MCB9808558.1 hypothetical protein [Candidatus Peribacteria bacterium]
MRVNDGSIHWNATAFLLAVVITTLYCFIVAIGGISLFFEGLVHHKEPFDTSSPVLAYKAFSKFGLLAIGIQWGLYVKKQYPLACLASLLPAGMFLYQLSTGNAPVFGNGSGLMIPFILLISIGCNVLGIDCT